MQPAALSRLTIALLVLTALTLPAPAAVPLPGGDTLQAVDFERHIMGLFGRMGCNVGACHGSFKVKGGFRLSLFGYDPDKDYTTLARDLLGRRINSANPDDSLLLLKATGQIDHGGGRRFSRDGWQYRVFREWIASGARWTKGSGDVVSLTVSPSGYALIKPGEKDRLRVQARFADGSEEDVTPFCDFRVQDDDVAGVTSLGEVKALRPGDTVLAVSYRGNVLALRILVPMPAAPGFRYPQLPEVNFIDREVFAKLRKLNVVPSELSSDTEFLRRVTIDIIGCLPSPDEVRAFLADKAANKRAKKIDELLAHPLHAALWATKFSDITGNSTLALAGKNGAMQAKYNQMWHDWFRKRVADNMPYDQIVKGVLCSTSRDGQTPEDWLKEVKAIEQAAGKGFDRTLYAARPSLDLFWCGGNPTPLEVLGEKTASAFMGIRLECAQCHKHPFDRWTQADYRAHANVFGQVTMGVSPEAKAVIDAENMARGTTLKTARAGGVLEVFVSTKFRALPHPDADAAGPVVKRKGEPAGPPPRLLPAQALGGPVIPIEPGKDARIALFDWLRSADNPYFARSFVNRVWGHYFGVGLVDPVDNFSLANPPSNEKLLDSLAKDFIDSKFDIRRLERTVLNARVYQLSSTMNETNKLDRNNYSHSFLRSMMAEVTVDVLNSALGVTEDFGTDAPAGCRAIEVGSSRVVSKNAAFAFRLFGRPLRTSNCDCDRATEPALPQTLYLMADQAVLDKLRTTAKAPIRTKGEVAPAVAEEPRLAKLLKSNKTDNEILDELFLATLSRFPSELERKHFADHIATRKNPAPAPVEPPVKGKPQRVVLTPRESSFVAALWALVNTREFILNH